MVDLSWQIRLFPMWPGDLAYIREAAARIGPAADVSDGFLELDRTLDPMRAAVFVGLKLDSVVLASAVHVSSIMIEYQPKCADFQASISRSDWSIRADEVRAEALVGQVETRRERYILEREALGAAVPPCCEGDSVERSGGLRGEVRRIELTV